MHSSSIDPLCSLRSILCLILNRNQDILMECVGLKVTWKNWFRSVIMCKTHARHEYLNIAARNRLNFNSLLQLIWFLTDEINLFKAVVKHQGQEDGLSCHNFSSTPIDFERRQKVAVDVYNVISIPVIKMALSLEETDKLIECKFNCIDWMDFDF